MENPPIRVSNARDLGPSNGLSPITLRTIVLYIVETDEQAFLADWGESGGDRTKEDRTYHILKSDLEMRELAAEIAERAKLDDDPVRLEVIDLSEVGTGR